MQPEQRYTGLQIISGVLSGSIVAIILFGLILWLGGLIVTFGSMYADLRIENTFLANTASILLICPPSLIFATLAAFMVRQSDKTKNRFSIPFLIIAVLGCAMLSSTVNLFFGQYLAKGAGEMSYYFILGYVSIFFPSLFASGMIGLTTGRFVYTLLRG